MNRNTGRRIVTTTNIVTYADRVETASHVWTADEMIGMWYTIDLYATSHTEMGEDTEVFEYKLPGQHVFVFMDDGEAITVITVEDEFIGRLHKAIRREHPVTIGYTKQYDGDDTVRTVEPTSLKITKSGDVTMGGRDRKTGEYRSFRVDRITDVTVHRSSFVIDEAYAARTTAAREFAKVQRIRQTAQRVVVGPKGYTGVTTPESAGLSAGGWSVIVKLDDRFAHVAVTGTIRASVDVLDIVPERVTTEEAFKALAAGRARSTSYTPVQRAAWKTLSRQSWN